MLFVGPVCVETLITMTVEKVVVIVINMTQITVEMEKV